MANGVNQIRSQFLLLENAQQQKKNKKEKIIKNQDFCSNYINTNSGLFAFFLRDYKTPYEW